MSIAVENPIEVPPGLRNVVVTETELGDVRGAEGFYHYRQYSAVELARSKTVEDVWFLMFEGRLPTDEERARFIADLAPLRVLPPEVLGILPAVAAAGPAFNPLAGLRTALSLLAAARALPPLWDRGPGQGAGTRCTADVLVSAVPGGD